MQMSDHELLYEYRHAVNPAAQIKVLAELNAVSVDAMRNKLLDLGADGTIGRARRAVHNIKYRKKMSEGRL